MSSSRVYTLGGQSCTWSPGMGWHATTQSRCCEGVPLAEHIPRDGDMSRCQLVTSCQMT
jgi:hypothetical protein